MSDTVLKVNYAVAEEAHYEILYSNESHFNKINSLIEEAKASVQYITDYSYLYNKIADIPGDVTVEKNRYMNFAPVFETFVGAVQSVDAQLKEAMQNSIDENCATQDLERIKEFVNNYAVENMLLDVSALMKMGISADDISTLLAMADLFEQLKGKSEAEVALLLQQTLADLEKQDDPVMQKIVNDLYKEYLSSPQKFMGNVVLESQDDLLVNVLMSMNYPLPTSAERAAIMKSFASLEKKLAAVDLKLTNNPYILPGGRTYGRKASLEKYLGQYQDQLDKLNEMDDALLKKLTTRNKWIVGGAIVAVQLAIELYDAVVVTGYDWDDASEKLISEALGIGIGIGVDAGATWLVTAITGTAVTGPAGIAIAVGSILVVTGYNVWLKEPVETWTEEQKDGWQQFWW